MEKERLDIQKELQEIQSAYNKVKGQKKATIGQLTVLQRKMQVQDKYIGNINREIRNITDDIYLSNVEINHLQIQLDTLKGQYARSVIYAYKNKSSYDFLNFIFSANNFNDALKRVAYLKSYRSYRQQQVASIVETQKMIGDRKQRLLGMQSQKKTALLNQREQLTELEDQKKEKAVVVAKLKTQEKDLSKQLASRKKRFRDLSNQIAAIVRREIERAKKEESDRIASERKKSVLIAPNSSSSATTKTTSGRPKSYLNLNASDVALNGRFEKNRGTLPWPVDNGYVSIPYGRSKVGQLETDNPGITISTPAAGSQVKAVFGGVVSAVSNLGDGMMVMVRHGKYFTVYSNLSSASVSKGAEVRPGEVIGHTSEAEDGTGGQMDFLLMNESKNVNPEPWLRRHH
ncbi:MAG: peptidoglycan DD-metalloendopeptidase family protein [Flavisolibacter sp.]